MTTTVRAIVTVMMIVTICATGCTVARNLSPPGDSSWQEEFGISECTLVPTGRNEYFVLEPGFQIVLEGANEKVAIGVAMDRAEIVSLDDTLETPAGTFSDCLVTMEGTALNPLEKEFKTYAPGIGLIQDAKLLLTEYGFAAQLTAFTTTFR